MGGGNNKGTRPRHLVDTSARRRKKHTAIGFVFFPLSYHLRKISHDLSRTAAEFSHETVSRSHLVLVLHNLLFFFCLFPPLFPEHTQNTVFANYEKAKTLSRSVSTNLAFIHLNTERENSDAGQNPFAIVHASGLFDQWLCGGIDRIANE